MSPSFRPAPPLIVPERVDALQQPDRKRLRGQGTRSIPTDSPPIAKILILEGGGHWRPVITRGANHMRFRMQSWKTGLTQVGEGKGEQRLAFLNEVDAKVWDYQCHPWQIVSQVGGRRFKYRPDAIRALSDGTIELIEVKRTFEDLRDADYREMLGKVREVCRQCGIRFRVMYLKDPRDTPAHREHDHIIVTPAHRDNVDVLFGRRYMQLSTKQERACREMQLAGASVSWQTARAGLEVASDLEGDAVLECAAARGYFAFDMTEPRTDATLLIPVSAMRGQSPIRL